MNYPTLLSKLILTAALAALAVGAGADGKWRAAGTETLPARSALRAYGHVTATTTRYEADGKAPVSVTRFACQGREQAQTVVGKFLADLALSPEVKTVTLTIAGRRVPVTVTPAGAGFVGCVVGSEARVLSSGTAAALVAWGGSHRELLMGARRRAPYPAYLDRFDRYGWGCYGMGGFNDFHGWRSKSEANPTEDVDFMVEHGLRFEPWLDPANFDNSDGIIKNTESEWMFKRAAEGGLDVAFRLYGDAGGADWTQRRFPEYAEQPASFLMSGWHGPSEFWKAQPHLTWYDPDIQRYMAVKAQDMIKEYGDAPTAMGWMHPQGELAHDPWYDVHDDYSATAARSWREYLQQDGVSLAEARRMYKRAQPFANWSQVPIPEYATFAGLGGSFLDLGGQWHYRMENSSNQAPAATWYDLPEEQKYAGVAGQWWVGSLETDWQTLNMPGSDMIFKVFPATNLYASSWWRRELALTAAQAGQAKVYLYWFPISYRGIHTGERARYHGVWLNGEKVGEIGEWGALDVTGKLREGQNEIALHLLGSVWDGRVFLSTEAPAIYPYLGEDMNRLWVLWKGWHNDSKSAAWWDILDGMRQADPNRPIKFMAPIAMGADRWLKLATRWGGFGHFTGEGMWYFPWYKRYGWLYEVPGSSETAGPANSVADQFDSFRRTFLAGLNGHDPVFLAQTYTRNPDLRQWWLDHDPVLKRMGKADIYGPQVLIYRSTRQEGELSPQWQPYPELGLATREVQSPWNWDIGRGTLQTLGQSYLYLDDDGVTDGKMNGFPLIIDGGNEALPPAVGKALAAWVRAGGTYVTLPFTGRNTYESPDGWPVRALTGCEIGKLRKPGAGMVTIRANQTVFQALAGKTFPDAGRSVDFQGGNHDILGVELIPGADCEVLATFENGAPAMLKRQLGRGTVIALGTAFWRSSQDIMGIWWPQPIETDFIGALLNGVNFPKASCTTDDRLVWAQPYRTNNGLAYSTTVVSWHDDEAAEVTLALRLPREPERLVCYGVDGVNSLPFTWDDGVATAKLHMPAKEVKVVDAEVFGPESAVEHWWGYQQRMWHQLETPKVDFRPYREGKWLDPTVDLRFGAELTNEPQSGEAWAQPHSLPPLLAGEGETRPGADEAGWKPCSLGVLNFEGALPGQPVWVRRSFTVPAAWLTEGGQTLLLSSSWAGPHYLGSAQMYLNGKRLHDWTTRTYNEFDVSEALLPGENVVGFAFRGDAEYQGFSGNVWLYHRTRPLQSVELAGEWSGADDEEQPVTVTLPGQGKAKWPTRTILIPKEWEGKYQVRLYMIGARESVLGAWVNERLVRRHHHLLGTRADVDITNHLEFGEENTLTLAYGNESNGPDVRPETVPNWDLSVLRLDLYPAQE